MTGVIRQLGPQSWAIDYRYPSASAPVLIGVRWPIREAKRTGPWAPEIADGLTVESVRVEGRNLWRAYAQGDYLCLDCARDGATLPDEPIPATRPASGRRTRR